MERWDHIVVGAGSAGCVLAGRLSEAGRSVLVLEAGGPDDDLLVKAPALFSGMFQGPLDWNYTSEPEPALGGRRLFLPRGRMLGGSSSMNALIYMRGAREDYDDWVTDHGAVGWSYEEVLPYFVRSETNADIHDGFHGTDGPLHVTTRRWLSPHAEAFIESAVGLGIERNPDFNGATQAGAGLFQMTAKDGRRCSAADAFLRPALDRPGVEVRTGALVRRVLVEDGRAVGVEFERDGVVETVRADYEVVLSAGSYNSPQLLMLSGIGPADHLREHGIEVVLDQPNVGAHLQDHPLTLMHWATSAGGTLAEAADPAHMEQWLADGTGMISSNAAEAAVLWRSDPSLTVPDFQLIFVPGWFWEHGMRRPAEPGMTIGLSYNGPSSQGTVRLRSTDPGAAPRILSNLLSERSEVDAVVRAVRFADEIASSGPLSAVLDERLDPGAGIDPETWVRAETQHMYHPTGTARIGTAADGVVDTDLRVHGIAGLRVVDASVMPRIPSGNTNAPTIMVGERGADLVLGRVAPAVPTPRTADVALGRSTDREQMQRTV
jgi:choline dehydrogenase